MFIDWSELRRWWFGGDFQFRNGYWNWTIKTKVGLMKTLYSHIYLWKTTCLVSDHLTDLLRTFLWSMIPMPYCANELTVQRTISSKICCSINQRPYGRQWFTIGTADSEYRAIPYCEWYVFNKIQIESDSTHPVTSVRTTLSSGHGHRFPTRNIYRIGLAAVSCQPTQTTGRRPSVR